MATTPRYVPTLTEVVKPARPIVQPGKLHSEPMAPYVRSTAGAPATPGLTAVIDPSVLAQDVIDRLTPQIETQLRRSAQDLLEMHLREVLPVVQMALEAEVRRAVEDAVFNRLGKPLGKT